MIGFFTGAAFALGVLLFLPLWRIARGPTIFDRLVGTGVMGTKTTVLLVLMGYAVGRADMFVDISLGYGLALLVGTLVTAKYLEASGEAGEGAGTEHETAPAPENHQSDEATA